MQFQLNPPACISADEYEYLYSEIDYDENEHDIYSPSASDDLRNFIGMVVEDNFVYHDQSEASQVADALTNDFINNHQ